MEYQCFGMTTHQYRSSSEAVEMKYCIRNFTSLEYRLLRFRSDPVVSTFVAGIAKISIKISLFDCTFLEEAKVIRDIIGDINNV